MKSKKILATIVAFASFMAVATSGLAAVTTTTTYNEIADKVIVDVDVTDATPDSEVTYLVKSNDAIVYIDQQTADENGAVSFDYKIAKDKIVGLTTDVQFGTNGLAAIDGDDKAIELANITVNAGDNAAIAFYKDAACENLIGEAAVVGDGDTIYAKITCEEGYEVDTVSGLETSGSDVYLVKANEVSFTTKSTYVAPEVQLPTEEGLADMATEEVKTENFEGEEIDAVQYTQVLKVVGRPSVVGVEYGHRRFPALTADGGAYESGKLYAVRIIVEKGVVITSLPSYYEE